MSSAHQWEWFEKILAHIEFGDQLTIDLTHGFRAAPIIVSTAVNFLQKARNVSLDAVLYGAFDKNRKLAPIVDMKEFYYINEWADAVSRLIDEADARKLADVAEKTSEFQAGELNDKYLIDTFEDLTNTVRNVDVSNVAEKANKALMLVKEKKKGVSETGKILLDLVIDKFTGLTTEIPPSGKYDRAYFEVQLEITKLLLNHKLYMQAYTVMREFIASMGMIPFELEGMNNRKRKKRRQIHAELFVKLFQFDEDEWKFSDDNMQVLEKLFQFYNELKRCGIESVVRSFAGKLADYRNGFDHAWTAKKEAYADIDEFGNECYEKLKQVLNLLETNNFLI